MIVDGGAGELAVTLSRDGVSYVGRGPAGDPGAILGVRLSGSKSWSAGSLPASDADCHDCSVTRSAEELDGLPRSVEFRSSEASLSFELKKVRPLRGRPRRWARACRRTAPRSGRWTNWVRASGRRSWGPIVSADGLDCTLPGEGQPGPAGARPAARRLPRAGHGLPGHRPVGPTRDRSRRTSSA